MNEEKYISCIIIKNEKGIIGKIATIFGDNDVNIENFTVSIANKENTIQKIIIVTTGFRTETVINNEIKLIPGVLDAFMFLDKSKVITKEVCLIKILNKNPKILDLVDIIKKFDGKDIFIDEYLTVYEVVDESGRVSSMLNRLVEIDMNIDISRGLVLASLENEFKL